MREEIGLLIDYFRAEGSLQGDLDPHADLVEANILDSFSIVQLVVFVQERFGIELEDEDFSKSNLSTLSGIVALIDKRRATTAP